MAQHRCPWEPDFLKSVGDDGNYLFLRQGFCADQVVNKPVIGRILEEFRNKFGQEMLADAVRSFHAPIVLADAINRAPAPPIRRLFAKLYWRPISPAVLPVPVGRIKFDPETHQNIYGQYIICQIQDQTFYTVFPSAFATRETVFPFPSWDDR